MIIPMTAHCHTHSCACASMSDSIELRNASDKSQGSPSSSGREAFSLGHAVPFRYENVPAELSKTDATSTTFNSKAVRIEPHLIKRACSFHTVRGGTVLSET